MLLIIGPGLSTDTGRLLLAVARSAAENSTHASSSETLARLNNAGTELLRCREKVGRRSSVCPPKFIAILLFEIRFIVDKLLKRGPLVKKKPASKVQGSEVEIFNPKISESW